VNSEKGLRSPQRGAALEQTHDESLTLGVPLLSFGDGVCIEDAGLRKQLQ
jgi:hypothetical protein